jgi:hypothetical protein
MKDRYIYGIYIFIGFIAYCLILIGWSLDCKNVFIRIWVMTLGVVYLLYAFFCIVVKALNIDIMYLHMVSLALLIYHIFATIIGTIWFVDYDVGPNYEYCRRLLYLIGYWLIVGSYAVLIVICVSSSVYGCLKIRDRYRRRSYANGDSI